MAKRDSIFISYAHDDDKNSNNWISLFKDVLQKELDIQSGQKVSIFFDRDTIEIGDEWKAKIDKTLEERTSHFIAFISMAYLKSEVCLYELEKMLGVERALGKMGMVLPIYFIGSGPMEEIDDPLIRKVVEKNYYDWRQFRFTPPSETEIRQKVAQVVSVILALRDSEDGAGAPKGEAGRPAHRPLSQRAVERKLASISGFVSPSKTVAADNDEVFIRREGCYDEVFSRAVDNALRRHEGKAIVLDLDCRGHEQAHHHLDVLGERAAHLFARVSKRELLPAEGDEVDPSVTYFYLPQSERFFEELCDVGARNERPLVNVEAVSREPSLLKQVGRRGLVMHAAVDQMHDAHELVVRERSVVKGLEALEGQLERAADEKGRFLCGVGRAVAVGKVGIFHFRNRPAVEIADRSEVVNRIVKKRCGFVHGFLRLRTHGALPGRRRPGASFQRVKRRRQPKPWSGIAAL